MAKVDMAKVKEQLAAAKRTVKKTSTQTNSKLKELIWKPEEGENVIRMVPNQYQEDSPFVKLTFHYQFTGKVGDEERNVTYISPTNFGKKDPIVELSDRLKASGDRKQWGQGKSLEPKARTYVPIIVRGREEEGVKYWGFGVQIFEDLVKVMDELDSTGESITDLLRGFDIKVDFIPAEKSNKVDPKTGKKFPETNIVVKRSSSPVVAKDHPKAREILEKITTQQPKLLDVWECPEYDVLSTALETFLRKRKAGQAASQGNVPTIEVETVTASTTTEVAIAEATSPSQAKAIENINAPSSTEDMKDVYDELFGLNK